MAIRSKLREPKTKIDPGGIFGQVNGNLEGAETFILRGFPKQAHTGFRVGKVS